MKEHTVNGTLVAEITATGRVINQASDGLDLLGNVYYQGYDKLILHQEQITPDFFDLKTGLAGELLQKFSNYHVRLAVVGDYSQLESKSLHDFIYESNTGRQINFVNSVAEALEVLAG